MKLLLSIACCALVAACSSTPKARLIVQTEPEGAQVFLARHGERNYQGNIGPVEGDVKKEDISEESVFIGDSPIEHKTLLEEVESGGTFFGLGAKVVLAWDEGVVRVEKAGYEPVERRIKLKDGEVKVNVELVSVETGD